MPEKITSPSPSPPLNAVIAKQNYLIPQLAKMELSELRLLTYCLAHYDSRPTDKEKTERQVQTKFTATVKDLLNIFPHMDSKSAYSVIKQAVKGVNSKPFEDTVIAPGGGKEDWFFIWFNGFRYRRDAGEFEFSMPMDLVELLLNLDGSFTKFRLKDVYQFKSALAWKLYENLKQRLVQGKWQVGLDELKGLLGIAGKYPAWRDLKKRLLTKPIQEINELSDIRVKFEVTKRVRTINGIVFFINSKEDEKQEDPNLVGTIGDTNNDIRLLMGVGITQSQAEKLSALAKETGKDLAAILERVKAKFEQKPFEERTNKTAYIFKALSNEFSPTLFDISIVSIPVPEGGATLIKKVAIDEKKQSQKNNKLAKEAINCPGFKERSATGKCKSEKSKSEKCKVCNKLVAA
ncbi:MAG: replication initiation protein [Lactococcus garvieae]